MYMYMDSVSVYTMCVPEINLDRAVEVKVKLVLNFTVNKSHSLIPSRLNLNHIGMVINTSTQETTNTA